MQRVESEPSYVAKLASVTPSGARQALSNMKACYLGVSLETRPFNRPMLDATVTWIAAHFTQCAVFIGDSLHRLTLQIVKEISPEEAATAAYELGSRFIEGTNGLFSSFNVCRFGFIRGFDIQSAQEFINYEAILNELFETDQEFKASIKRSAVSFINRRRYDLIRASTTRERMIALSCKYIIEEMAIFACLVRGGWQVEVYPGSELPVLVEVAEGRYGRVPDPLKSRVNVALKISAR
jgi:tRNA-dependent cyclodipeptide synthase